MSAPGSRAAVEHQTAPDPKFTIVVPAPAKLNLFLHVAGRVADGPHRGYHQLESLMVLVDLADRVRLTRRDDGRVQREHAIEGVSEADDLCLRAAKLLQERTGSRFGVSIALDKRIPIGAGLGGGSSDAASVLLGLIRLWGLEGDLDRAELMRIGVELGADVPFFIFGRNAHATGIGEILRAVTVPRAHVLIAAPDVGVSTATIFGAAGLERATPPTGAMAFPEGCGRNDLEPVAIAREGGIAVAAKALDERLASPSAGSGAAPEPIHRAGSLTSTPYPARMTGSGSAVYRIVDATDAAACAPCTHDPRGFRVFRARFLGSHPLREFVAK